MRAYSKFTQSLWAVLPLASVAAFILFGRVGVTAQEIAPAESLQQRIDAAAPGAVLEMGAGTFHEAIVVTKPITLRGKGMDKTAIEFLGDKPAIEIRDVDVAAGGSDKNGVRIQNLTVRWGLRPTDARMPIAAAVSVRDSSATLEFVRLTPIDRPLETPNGLVAAGRSAVTFDNGATSGFAFAIVFTEGANGAVKNSILADANNSLVTLHENSRVEIAGNGIGPSRYHGVRNTGGTMDMRDNIVGHCEKAGAYLGNKDAHGVIRNNVFAENGGGVWGYYGSDAAIVDNVFAKNRGAGAEFWDSCRLVIERNSFVENPVALRRYDKSEVDIGARLAGNHFWSNGRDYEAIEADPRAIAGDPRFPPSDAPVFAPLAGSALLEMDGMTRAGLSSPEAIRAVWQRIERLKKMASRLEGAAGSVPQDTTR